MEQWSVHEAFNMDIGLRRELGAAYTVYFYAEFSEAPTTAQTFSGANTDPMPRYQNLANGGISQATFGKTNKETSGPMNRRVGALFTWNDGPASQIVSRIGISFISTDRARSYIDAEILSWNLNDTVTAAVQEWNQDVFSKIQVPIDESANVTNLRLLYSSLYFMHLMPANRTGENPLWDSGEPFWDDFYTLCELGLCLFIMWIAIADVSQGISSAAPSVFITFCSQRTTSP
jgi:putative alpha-1,2-mannosidase